MSHILPDTIFKLETSDHQILNITYEALQQSQTLTNLAEGFSDSINPSEEPIPVKGVSEPNLRKIIEWCEHHKGEPLPTPEESQPKTVVVPEWDRTFLEVSDVDLFDLICAANFLDIKRLLNYSCRLVSDMAKNKTPGEMRARFGIE
uniref:Skp1-related protein n=1 Tax=Caenorhabditis tropicalis TaxID=1561998 RepID=A0A1I7TKZ3_9PELO